MPEAYYLTEEDVTLLREVMSELRVRRRNTSGRPAVPSDTYGATDVYMAKTPSGGIAGVTDDTPAVETCDIYYLESDGTLAQTNLTREVLNLSDADVPEDIYVPIARERYGRWVISGSGAGNGSKAAYMAKTDGAGIPAISGDTPGSGVCDLYKLEGGSLVNQSSGTGTALTVGPVTVYNLMTIAVPANAWVTIIKDAYGEWMVPSQGLNYGPCP